VLETTVKARILALVSFIYVLVYIYLFIVVFVSRIEALLTYYVLNVLGANVSVEGETIIFYERGNFEFSLTPEYSGLSAVLIYVAMVTMVSNVPVKKKVIYGIAGSVILLLVDIQRIMISGALLVLLGERAFIAWLIFSQVIILFVLYLMWCAWIFFERVVLSV